MMPDSDKIFLMRVPQKLNEKSFFVNFTTEIGHIKNDTDTGELCTFLVGGAGVWIEKKVAKEMINFSQ